MNAAKTMAVFFSTSGIERFSVGFGAGIAFTIFIVYLGFSIIHQKLLTQEER